MNINFNEDEVDALREFMNVAIGSATSNIADLLDAFATIHIPKITICNSEELIKIVSSSITEESNYHVIKQLFAGKFGGESMFVMKDESSRNLGNHLYDITNPSHDDITDAVMELTNILTSTVISKLTHDFGTQVQFFVPSSQYLNSANIVSYEDIKDYSKIIIISTVLDFQDQKIDGFIFILTKDEAILRLKELINIKLEELYS